VHNHPFRRTADARALRGDLEEILQEFWRGNPDGPVVRRLIKESEKEQARARQIWDASLNRARRVSVERRCRCQGDFGRNLADDVCG
jgi:hypothetical protein